MRPRRPCNGPTYHPAEHGQRLLTEGRIIDPSVIGEINELISPAQNHYNSLFVQLQRRMSQGFSLQFSYTFAKSIMLDGMDFNNQFDFSNTHAPSLLDQRHRLTLAECLSAQARQIDKFGNWHGRSSRTGG